MVRLSYPPIQAYLMIDMLVIASGVSFDRYVCDRKLRGASIVANATSRHVHRPDPLRSSRLVSFSLSHDTADGTKVTADSEAPAESFGYGHAE
jgi:hypothetical protein